MAHRFTHVAVTVPHALFVPEQRTQLLKFYEDVFGWTENPGLSIEGKRIFLRAPTNGQYITIRSDDRPMQTSGYEHLGIEVDRVADLHDLHARAHEYAERDTRVELEDVEVLYGGALHTFRVRFLLPLTLEIQFFDESLRETLRQ